MKGKIFLFVILGIVGACVLSALGIYSYVNGLRKTGITTYEKPISAQYQACQVTYSSYTAGFTEQFGIYQVTMKGLDQFMSDAVKGRYDTTDAVGNPTGQIDANLFVNAIAEQYPNTQGITDIAQKLLDFVQGQREGFKNCQEKLVDMLNQYDGWRTGDMINNFVINNILGFPTDNLVARLGDQKWTGAAAEDKMYQLVLTGKALDAYESGIDQPLITPAP